MSAAVTSRVPAVQRALEPALRAKIDRKTKPPGALGELEQLAVRIGLVQETLTPRLNVPAVVVFAADHGIATEGVSPYPSEVTAQMVANFLAGGAAINVFARAHDLDLRIVDAGVAVAVPPHPDLTALRIGPGTRNFAREPAMTRLEAETALESGARVVAELERQGTNVVGFGEMGIGNSSSAGMLMSLLLNVPLADCVGRGSGLGAAGVAHKLDVLSRARRRILRSLGIAPAALALDPVDVLTECGGFEIAMIAGGMLRAAERRLIVLVDGFIACAALLVARAIDSNVLDYCVFTHCSEEKGHARMLAALGAEPLLDLGLRLGEGTGAALAYPLVRSAVAFLNDMASFESAGVTGRREES